MSDKLAEALLPCPFCGGDKLRVGVVTGRVFCMTCGAESERWNTRATLAAYDAAPGPAVMVKPLQWVQGFYETRDHDDVNKNWPYNLQAWRAEGYLIIYQGAPHGLYVLRTPSGENQVASHDLNIAKAAAQADYEARILAALAPAASPAPWSLPPEADRPHGYRCLALIWRVVEWDEGIKGWGVVQPKLEPGLNEYALPETFAPLPYHTGGTVKSITRLVGEIPSEQTMSPDTGTKRNAPDGPRPDTGSPRKF